MRRIALLGVLCLLAVACGDESTFVTATTAAATSTSTTPLATSSTTSTPTAALVTYAVPAEDLCVIDHLSDDALNLRSGPGGTFAVIGTLPFDATGVEATGVGAADAEGRTWKEIDYPGGPGWVAGWLVTADACTVAAPGDYCVTRIVCTDRLEVHRGPGPAYEALGSLPHYAYSIDATGASSVDEGGMSWQQIRFRGEVGWVPASFLTPDPCSPSQGEPCSLPANGEVAPDCVGSWERPWAGERTWNIILEGLAGWPASGVDPSSLIVEDMRLFFGPEDADIVSPRPIDGVARVYLVAHSEMDPDFRGRWLLRYTPEAHEATVTAVATYDSTGFGPGIWETCPAGCQVGRPLAGEWCNPACVEDYFGRSCQGLAPGAWSVGDCAGPPPEVLGCLEP